MSSKDFCIAPVTNPKAFLFEKALSLGPRTKPKNWRLYSFGSLKKPLNLVLQLVSSESKFWSSNCPLIELELIVKLAFSLILLEGVYVKLNSDPIRLLFDKFIGYDSKTGTWSIGALESLPTIRSTISPVSSVILSILPSDCL